MNFNYFSEKINCEVIFDVNSKNKIFEHIKNKNFIVFTSKSHTKRGQIKKILKGINERNFHIIDRIDSHAGLDNIWDLYLEIKKIKFISKIDYVLAIGGGSVLDVSKILSVKSIYKKKFDNIKSLIQFLSQSNDTVLSSYKFIAVPTTSGTSSELTKWSTVWDYENKKKLSISNPNFSPEIIFYDPSLTLSLSKKNTIISALDAFSHSLESIWNYNTSDYVINNASIAAKLIFSNLPKLINDKKNIDYRSKIMLASYFAGKSFSITETSIAHALSYYITLEKNIPHGIACSFTLFQIVKLIEKNKKYKKIKPFLEDIFGKSPSKKLNLFFKKINIPIKFSYYGISLEDFNGIIKSAKESQRYKNSMIDLNDFSYS